MKRMTRFFVAFAALISIANGLRAEPLVENVRAAQQEGTKHIRILYDLVGTPGETADVTVAVTVDGSDITASAFSGAVGEDISIGTDKEVIWDMEADWNQQYSENVVFTVNAESPPPVVPDDMILMPGGTFTMGDTFAEGSEDELPLHEVTLSPFFIGKYEISKGGWDEVKTWAEANKGYTFSRQGEGKTADHPVNNIKWHDAVKWCNARSEKELLTPCYYSGAAVYRTGEDDNVTCDWSADGYRLPTEAEWEATCRGGVANRRFPDSDTLAHAQANYRASTATYDTSGTIGFHPTYYVNPVPYTAPVGSFPPMANGIYDILGNVAEFCWDYRGTYTAAAVTNPRGPATGTERAVRGGSWTTLTDICRNAARKWATAASNAYGFRVARRVP